MYKIGVFVKIGGIYRFLSTTAEVLQWYPLDEYNKRSLAGERMWVRTVDPVSDRVCVESEVTLEVEGGLSVDTLPKGIYIVRNSMQLGTYFVPESFDHRDRFMVGSRMEMSLRLAIDRYVMNKGRYDRLGIAHRRGLLLYGPPGNGKTRTAIEVIREIAKTRYCFIVDDIPSSQFRRAFQNEPCVVVIEEITDILDYGGVSRFLNFMDGTESMNQALVICTTNYPEYLPANVIDRPSRFDELMYCDNPDAAERRRYLDHFWVEMNLPDEEKSADVLDDDLVDWTIGFSVAYLKELVLYAKLSKCTLKDSFNVQKERRSMIRSGFKSRRTGWDVISGFDAKRDRGIRDDRGFVKMELGDDAIMRAQKGSIQFVPDAAPVYIRKGATNFQLDGVILPA